MDTLEKEIVFLPVTTENRQEIIEIELEDFQKGFIETPEECLKEAESVLEWRPKGIYYKKNLIGFTMYGKLEKRVWLDRFLIDRKYQNKGYGKKALKYLIEILWTEYLCGEIFLSLYEENKAAMHLYQSFGFWLTKELDTKGEKVMVLKKHIWEEKRLKNGKR